MPAQVGIDFLSHIYSTSLSAEVPEGRDSKGEDLKPSHKEEKERWALVRDDAKELPSGALTPEQKHLSWFQGRRVANRTNGSLFLLSRENTGP